MVLAQEPFTSVLIVTEQNGNIATGKTINYRIFDETLSLFDSGTMTEIGAYGIYYKTWTPDADGYWIFEAYYVGSDFKFYDIKMYQVGRGVEDEIFERIGAPNYVTIAGDIANLITRAQGLDEIHDDLVVVDTVVDTILTGLILVAGDVTAILADTNELQTDWTDGGRLDLIIDAILADTNELQTDWTNGGRLDLIIDAILADTNAILVDTNELQTDWTDGGRLDLIIDAILADTNELQTDWVDGGRLDLIIDAILADTNAILVDTNELQTDWTNGGRLDLIIDAILADTNELQTDWVDGGRLDLIIDAILADTVTINWTNVTDILTDTNELQTDWVDGGRLDLIIDAILADTATINWTNVTDILADTNELQTDWTDGGRLDLLIDGIIADIGTFPTANYASLAVYVEDIRTRLIAIVGDTNELQIDWTDGGRLDLILDDILADTANLDNLIQVSSTVNGAGGTVDMFDTLLAEATDDHYNGLILMFTSGNLAGQSRLIIDYDGATKEITVHPSLTEAPADTDNFSIFAGGYQGAIIEGSKGLEQIYDLVDQLHNLNRIGDTITTDGSEQNLWINEDPLYPMEAIKLIVDFTNHTAGETVELKEYYKIRDGGNWIRKATYTYVGVQDPELIVIDLEPNLYGIQLTIETTAGANRDYDYEVFFNER